MTDNSPTATPPLRALTLPLKSPQDSKRHTCTETSAAGKIMPQLQHEANHSQSEAAPCLTPGIKKKTHSHNVSVLLKAQKFSLRMTLGNSWFFFLLLFLAFKKKKNGESSTQQYTQQYKAPHPVSRVNYI